MSSVVSTTILMPLVKALRPRAWALVNSSGLPVMPFAAMRMPSLTALLCRILIKYPRVLLSTPLTQSLHSTSTTSGSRAQSAFGPGDAYGDVDLFSFEHAQDVGFDEAAGHGLEQVDGQGLVGLALLVGVLGGGDSLQVATDAGSVKAHDYPWWTRRFRAWISRSGKGAGREAGHELVNVHDVDEMGRDLDLGGVAGAVDEEAERLGRLKHVVREAVSGLDPCIELGLGIASLALNDQGSELLLGAFEERCRVDPVSRPASFAVRLARRTHVAGQAQCPRSRTVSWVGSGRRELFETCPDSGGERVADRLGSARRGPWLGGQGP